MSEPLRAKPAKPGMGDPGMTGVIYLRIRRKQGAGFMQFGLVPSTLTYSYGYG